MQQGSSDKCLNHPISIKSFQLCLFAMSIVLLVKILGLLVCCDKVFPVSSGYCNTRDTYSRKSGIILSTYFQRLVFSQGRESRPLPRNGVLHAPRAGWSGLIYQSKLKNRSPYVEHIFSALLFFKRVINSMCLPLFCSISTMNWYSASMPTT